MGSLEASRHSYFPLFSKSPRQLGEIGPTSHLACCFSSAHHLPSPTLVTVRARLGGALQAECKVEQAVLSLLASLLPRFCRVNSSATCFNGVRSFALSNMPQAATFQRHLPPPNPRLF